MEDANETNDETSKVSSDESTKEAFFTPLEARVIASLMEKHLTTPNNYPLTMNSLTNACNQKSNREPVMNLTEGQIGHTVNLLVERNLAGLDYGERANKISHHVSVKLDIDRKQQAILTVMMLRKPQTLNDIKTRTARMAEFADLTDLHETLDSMIDREESLVVLIPKGAGRREDRYTHTLCGEIDSEDIQKDPTAAPASLSVDNDRLGALEARIAVLEAKLGINTEDS